MIPNNPNNLPVLDISDDENEDWLRTVRKQMQAEQETAPDPLAAAKDKRRAEKIDAFTKKK